MVERRACTPLLNESGLLLEGVASPFLSGELAGKKHEFCFGACLSCFLVGPALVTVVCFFLSHEPPT